jgi:hypothetical protein
MIATLIGIISGLLVILTIRLLKFLDKQVIYGLILTAIGFLYVGYTWKDTASLVISSAQAILFIFIAYYGVKKSLLLLTAGYFLHGLWDLAFDLFPYSNSIPPHYDLFCLSIDFTIGFYLITLYYRSQKQQR